MNLLEVRDLVAGYGGVQVLKAVSLDVPRGQVVSVLGANGAGKSTLLKAISGQIGAVSGSIVLDGESIFGVPGHRMASKGIAVAPEGRKLFPEMTVYENLVVGGYSIRDRRQRRERLERVIEVFPRVKERVGQRASLMSGGEQQMVAIARALMIEPKLLILDEPTLGLAPKLIQEVAHIIREIAATGVSILLVEQNARLALQLSQYGYILESGQVALQGLASAILDDDRVRRIYLGG